MNDQYANTAAPKALTKNDIYRNYLRMVDKCHALELRIEQLNVQRVADADPVQPHNMAHAATEYCAVHHVPSVTHTQLRVWLNAGKPKPQHG